MDQLIAWMRAGANATTFPYHDVLADYHRRGKHAVPAELLAMLDNIRAGLPALRGPTPALRRLQLFLDTALDKWDGRYDYATYLALSLLPLPDVDDPNPDPGHARRLHDRLYLSLLADALRFELAAADGATDLLPRGRPDPKTFAKRCRLGLRAAAPALLWAGTADEVTAPDPAGAARRLCDLVDSGLSTEHRLVVDLSMLPVDVVHDEWMFIRVLQAWEAVFALLGVELQVAIDALHRDEPATAVRMLRAGESALRESAPLFSLLATMRAASFHAFRLHTHGASAIQSHHYKITESRCRRPDPQRLNSAAFHATPDVWRRVHTGQPTIDDAVQASRVTNRLDVRQRELVYHAMRGFATALTHWRQTHYRLARRMLGDAPGTGYTEGTRYLQHVRTIPVFVSLGTTQTSLGPERQPGQPEHQ